ncbi:MAG TPA: FMN-binding negative transcriptional regulator [Solirubrobacterales bacterium]|nr:FMN-binding negative transcriptional regulator [Solirubrobacterales bacterium]
MRHNPAYDCTDPALVRELIEENPWATLVSGSRGLVASHYPVLLDEEAEELTILTHLGKPDQELHGIGEGELLVIVQGHHGYVSPSWYAPGATRAPTWNFSVAHLYGTPEVLSEEENLQTLTRLVERFEREVEKPLFLEREWATPFARGTVGIRLRVERFTCKRKLSQDKDPVSRRNVIERLREPGPYHHPALADEVERELD